MANAQDIITKALEEHRRAVTGCFEHSTDTLIRFASRASKALSEGNKIMICGNGGSACDALHFAGELVGRFVHDRRALPAIALTADPGILTAVGNDYGFEYIFSRQIEAHARAGDLLITISTSGKSPNIIQALQTARELQIPSLLLTGEKGKAVETADEIIAVPSMVTAHIQETHIMLLQLMVALIENDLF
ncbi:MAG: phosphoheptose isomerase [Rickettsiales bacterium]|nr:phosphoheptose isomerase [Rickettsiales bacterium]